jgi:L-seryl-tRNA(Ser) seleniumtransferase
MSQSASPLRSLPSIDELLNSKSFRAIAESHGRAVVLRIARSSLDDIRTELRSNIDQGNRDVLIERIGELALKTLNVETSRRISRVINATGVIVHTNLGRSALSVAAIESFRESSGYCNLEFDLVTASRGKRGTGAEAMICELTGAEAAVIVNNCAAATFLVLRAVAAGKEVIISRGELVEIGGDFRVPDVLTESGAILCEVGTTNRTKLADYEQAINENTGLILRVHPSNYRVVGFTESPSNAQLAALARDNNIPFFEDAGSGALVDLSEFGIDEPRIAASIEEGVDIVAFSGDKLMGSVQGGFIVGRRDLIESIRRHPLYRAFRVDKLAYGAIEATLAAYARGTEFDDIPTLRMIALDKGEIQERAQALTADVHENVGLEMIDGYSVVGGGAAPTSKLPTSLIAISKAGGSAEQVDAYFRERSVPIVGRISDDNFLIDLRSVDRADDEQIRNAIDHLAGHEF